MLMIRFQRIGRTNDPAFRILVLEKASGPKAGTYTDLLGTYNPKTKALTIAEDRLKKWMSQGAQVSPSLMNLLINKKILEGKKTRLLSKKNLEKNKAKEEEAKAAAAAAEAAASVAAAPVEEATAPVEEEVAAPTEAEIEAEALPADDASESPTGGEVAVPAEEAAPEAAAAPVETPAEAAAAVDEAPAA